MEPSERAVFAYLLLMLTPDTDQKEQILADLTEYCKMDTWAMVRVWQRLSDL